MSIFLSNFVQVAQGPRVKSIPPLFNDVIVLMSSSDGYDVSVSYKQLMVWAVTAALLGSFAFRKRARERAADEQARVRARVRVGATGIVVRW